ncbi:MAG TPA: hypothetical protein VM032_04070 [Vicinamibacterales bacterium]|nr:hypothetical protein [Vicinamibacterales bacterium]
MRARAAMAPPGGSVMPRNASPARPIDRVAYPDALERAEAELLVLRRQSAGMPIADDARTRLPDDAVGMGLSGGGVRSATFALGVFQALARSACLDRIDFLSTVSGGGYFGSFLGRLFTREWILNVKDVEQVLVAEEPPPGEGPRPRAWAARVFRWLRENGRYLAPRGSGDVILLGALLLRNWLSVQLVLIVSMLAAFGALQIGRIWLERLLVWFAPAFDATNWLVCRMPLGNWLLWWSPLVITPLVPLLLIAAPAGWAYWLVSRDADGVRGVPAWVGAVFTLVLAAAGAYRYRAAPLEHPARLTACLVVASLALLALLLYVGGEAVVRWRATRTGASPTESGNQLRATFTRWMKTGMLSAAVLLGAALVDTVGGTVYAVSGSGDLTRWGAAVFGAFAAVGAFARPLFLLLTPSRRSSRPGMRLTLVSWLAAIVVMAVWLVSIDVASHALRWGFHAATGQPAGLGSRGTTPILGADALVVTGSGDERTVTARMNDRPPACTAPPLAWPALPDFLLDATVTLALFALLFGQTRRFANLSSVHGFYTDQLTRSFLGASNELRMGAPSKTRSGAAIVKGDDCSGARYWLWPRPPGHKLSPQGAAAFAKPHPWHKGGPLHIVNTTVNETVDGRSGVQNQDRKGIGLAVGPTALSLGIRHHLVTGAAGWMVFPDEEGAHRVFKADSTTVPEPLSLGRWMSISGAAFSAAAGSNTTVPLAILCGMFNVRLGYWWNSGTGFGTRWLDRIFPVQTALFAEMFARTHGTQGQLWNISDGGHFENMGGYELIRRRLPVIVLIDAEADPDYTFQGLSDFVRKARLDFRSEIVFLSAFDLDGVDPEGRPNAAVAPLPASVRSYFGDLDALRRGRWVTEDLTDNHGKVSHRFTLEAERTRPSKAHAALARVVHGDANDPDAARSWLIYVKATLMGDEPEDVCHYHRSHPDFPQETTLDQFFDEAQWESYRRLGQHVGRRVLSTELFDYLRANPA